MPDAAFFGLGMKAVTCGTVDLQGDLFGAMLCNGYVPNVNTHRFRSDVTAESIGTSGYTIGGATIAGNTVSYDSASHETRWTFTNPSWTQASLTATTLVVYHRAGGTSSADELILYQNFGTQTVTLGTFTFQLGTSGIAAITT